MHSLIVTAKGNCMRADERIDISKLTAESRLARADLVQLITDRVRDPNDNIREARNKVSHRITYAIDTGALAAPGDDSFELGIVALWARLQWPGKLDDLPVSPVSAWFASSARLSDRYDAIVIPGQLDQCQDALKKAYDKIEQMEKGLRSLYAELERLAPLASKWEEFCEKNRQSAKKPRERG